MKTDQKTLSDVNITYDKFYTDDTGKHIPQVFSAINQSLISIKSFWGGSIDAFYKHDNPCCFTCLTGDLRIVTATEQLEEDKYKFSQYFISGLDGKVINLPAQKWFGIHNLSNNISIAMFSCACDNGDMWDKLSHKIFNWNSKKS